MSVYWITVEVRSGLVSLHVTVALPTNTRNNILVTIINDLGKNTALSVLAASAHA